MRRACGPGFFTGLILGGLLGLGLAMLFAPKSGAETRRALSDWRATHGGSPDEAPAPSSEVVDLGLAVFGMARERLERAREAARQAAAEARLRLSREWAETRGGGAS